MDNLPCEIQDKIYNFKHQLEFKNDNMLIPMSSVKRSATSIAIFFTSIIYDIYFFPLNNNCRQLFHFYFIYLIS